MDIEGVPLRTTLRLVLRQLGLTYYVDDGLLVVISLHENIETQARPVVTIDTSPKTMAIVEVLNKPCAMPFPNETPLENILHYILNKPANEKAGNLSVPIFVDPKALEKTRTSVTSPVVIDVDGVPLRTTLRLLLRQLGLAYSVDTGFLMIRQLNDEVIVLDKLPEGVAVSLETKAILAKLNEPIGIPFVHKTKLSDVLTYITKVTKRPGDSGIPIDVAPEGLRNAGKSLTSTVTLKFDSVPLRFALPAMLQQLKLGYYVKDGRLIIDHPATIYNLCRKAGKV